MSKIALGEGNGWFSINQQDPQKMVVVFHSFEQSLEQARFRAVSRVALAICPEAPAYQHTQLSTVNLTPAPVLRVRPVNE